MANKLSENYVPVNVRMAKFRVDHGTKGSIETSVTTDFEKAIDTVRAVVSVEGRVLGTGHARGEAGTEKELEKTETIAVGRALAMAGYEAEDGVASAEEMEGVDTSKDSGRSRFGAKRSEQLFEKKVSKNAPAVAPVATKQVAETEDEAAPAEIEPAPAQEAKKPAPPETTTKTGTNTTVANLMSKYKTLQNKAPSTPVRR